MRTLIVILCVLLVAVAGFALVQADVFDQRKDKPRKMSKEESIRFGKMRTQSAKDTFAESVDKSVPPGSVIMKKNRKNTVIGRYVPATATQFVNGAPPTPLDADPYGFESQDHADERPETGAASIADLDAILKEINESEKRIEALKQRREKLLHNPPVYAFTKDELNESQNDARAIAISQLAAKRRAELAQLDVATQEESARRNHLLAQVPQPEVVDAAAPQAAMQTNGRAALATEFWEDGPPTKGLQAREQQIQLDSHRVAKLIEAVKNLEQAGMSEDAAKMAKQAEKMQLEIAKSREQLRLERAKAAQRQKNRTAAGSDDSIADPSSAQPVQAVLREIRELRSDIKQLREEIRGLHNQRSESMGPATEPGWSEPQPAANGTSPKSPRFAICGKIDLDGDGDSDREWLHKLVAAANGTIETEVDDEGSLTGPGVTADTTFLVMSEAEGHFWTNDKQTRARDLLKQQAQQHGVRIITLQAFLRYLDSATRFTGAVSGGESAVVTGVPLRPLQEPIGSEEVNKDWKPLPMRTVPIGSEPAAVLPTQRAPELRGTEPGTTRGPPVAPATAPVAEPPAEPNASVGPGSPRDSARSDDAHSHDNHSHDNHSHASGTPSKPFSQPEPKPGNPPTVDGAAPPGGPTSFVIMKDGKPDRVYTYIDTGSAPATSPGPQESLPESAAKFLRRLWGGPEPAPPRDTLVDVPAVPVPPIEAQEAPATSPATTDSTLAPTVREAPAPTSDSSSPEPEAAGKRPNLRMRLSHLTSPAVRARRVEIVVLSEGQGHKAADSLFDDVLTVEKWRAEFLSLAENLRKEKADPADVSIEIQVGKETPHRQIEKLLRLSREAGFRKTRIQPAKDKKEEDKTKY